jgi:hypothetical protein
VLRVVCYPFHGDVGKGGLEGAFELALDLVAVGQRAGLHELVRSGAHPSQRAERVAAGVRAEAKCEEPQALTVLSDGVRDVLLVVDLAIAEEEHVARGLGVDRSARSGAAEQMERAQRSE